MNRPPLKLLTDLIGLALCIFPPALTVLAYFPIWVNEGGGKLLSGFTVILLVLCALPLSRYIKQLFRSPAVYTPWLIMLILFLVLSKIAEEMTVISLVGFLGNLAGAAVMKLGKRGRVTKDEE